MGERKRERDRARKLFFRLRLASLYLQLKQFDLAKNVFLLACRDSPSSLTWLGKFVLCAITT